MFTPGKRVEGESLILVMAERRSGLEPEGWGRLFSQGKTLSHDRRVRPSYLSKGSDHRLTKDPP